MEDELIFINDEWLSNLGFERTSESSWQKHNHHLEVIFEDGYYHLWTMGYEWIQDIQYRIELIQACKLCGFSFLNG